MVYLRSNVRTADRKNSEIGFQLVLHSGKQVTDTINGTH